MGEPGNDIQVVLLLITAFVQPNIDNLNDLSDGQRTARSDNPANKPERGEATKDGYLNGPSNNQEASIQSLMTKDKNSNRKGSIIGFPKI